MRVKLHWSAVVLAALFALIYYFGYNKTIGADIGEFRIDTLLISVIIGCGVIVTIFFHEWLHYVASKRCGIEVEHITIHFLGGSTKINNEDIQRPNHLFFIASAGLIGHICFILIVIIIIPFVPFVAQFILTQLSLLNLFILIINAIPMFPLDGWRIVWSVCWYVKKDKQFGMWISGFFSLLTAFFSIIIFIWIVQDEFMVGFSIFSALMSVCMISFEKPKKPFEPANECGA